MGKRESEGRRCFGSFLSLKVFLYAGEKMPQVSNCPQEGKGVPFQYGGLARSLAKTNLVTMMDNHVKQWSLGGK